MLQLQQLEIRLKSQSQKISAIVAPFARTTATAAGVAAGAAAAATAAATGAADVGATKNRYYFLHILIYKCTYKMSLRHFIP